MEDYISYFSETAKRAGYYTPTESTLGGSDNYYDQLLIDTIARPFTLGLIRIEVLDGKTDNLNGNLRACKFSMFNGTEFTSPLTPYTALNQFITTAIEIPCDFGIDSDTAIRGSLVANSSICITFFPAHIHSVSRTISNRPVMKGLARPQLGVINSTRNQDHQFDREDEKYMDRQSGIYHNPSPVRPYKLFVHNNNAVQTDFILFGANQNRCAANYGNPFGIKIDSGGFMSQVDKEYERIKYLLLICTD